MTNPTYNPVGFGVGYCGYAACDYDCAEGYHWDPQATGNVFQEAKNQRGNCIYNYRFCEKLRTGGLVWTAATAANPTITYLARHLQPELWPDQDYSITGNLAQRWIAGRWEPARANTTPHIYAGDPQEPCTFDCQDPLNTHRDAVL